MLPQRSTVPPIEPKANRLAGAFQAIRSLVDVMERHVATEERRSIKWCKGMGPSQFKGTPNPMEVEAWLMQLEEIFEVINCDEEKKILFAIFMLRGEAKHWWRETREPYP